MKQRNETQQLQLILESWSSSLSIDDETGESIITESDLHRLLTILILIFGSTSNHLPVIHSRQL